MANKKTAELMWQGLEVEHSVPKANTLRYLSGLLEEDIQRLKQAWSALPVKVRQKLAQTLADLAEADFEMDFSAVFRLALNDEDATVRVSAIEGLCEDEDVRLVPQFVKMVKEDPAVPVRAAAAQALARFMLLGELDKIRPRPFEMALAALNEAHANVNENLEVRRRALESLAYTGLAGVPAMIEAAYRHPEEKMRISAVFAMGRSADKRWGKIVREELNSLLPEMRFEATRACGELELREAAQQLIELVEDVDPEVQEMALWSLGQVGGDLARRALMRYVHSDSEALQNAAQAALDELEFFHGDLSTFFGPSPEFYGESDLSWKDEDEFDADLEDESEEEDDLWLP
jgi:HEAT repeat protein